MSNTRFYFETFLEIVSGLILQHKGLVLKNSEITILKGVWKGQTYKEIDKDKTENENYYCEGHLYDVGSKLWRDLSKALGKKVNKSNVKFIIEQEWQWRRDTQSNLPLCQTQLRNCFVVFLWMTRSAYVELGNIDSSCNLSLKNSAGKLFQKPLKFDRDTELTDEIVVQVIDNLIYFCTGKHLTFLEKAVILGVWNGEKYDDIANNIKRSRCMNKKDKNGEKVCSSNCHCKYSLIYLRKDIAYKLWAKLSKVFIFLDYKINKNNFKPTIERCHENMKSNFSTHSY